MKRLIISAVVGYMLKVLKSQKEISNGKKEFDAIRHGDYAKFIKLVDGPIPFTVTYHEGKITSGNIPPQEDDIDFALLIKAGPSLKIFYANCLQTYGPINDSDLTDDIFELLAIFEITLRMHASNNKLATATDVLSDVITRLCILKEISPDETATIHSGRKFLNMVKHNKNQFSTWSEGASILEKAHEILKQYKLAD